MDFLEGEKAAMYFPEGGEAATDLLEDEAGAGRKKDWVPRISEFINILASRGTALTFEHDSGHFHVLDGTQFQKEYCALRSNRDKKNQAARDRPFAQMHRVYVIVRGDKWAATGTVFRAKDPKHAPQCSPPPCQDFEENGTACPPHAPHAVASASLPQRQPVQANDVIMQIRNTNGEEMDMSLQHYLDVRGAGALYSAARGRGGAAVQQHSGSGNAQARANVEQGVALWAEHFEGQEHAGLWAEEGAHAGLWEEHGEHVMEGVWNATSKGDHAYFFKRR
eukprot:915284-Rhodomonas_salina.1